MTVGGAYRLFGANFVTQYSIPEMHKVSVFPVRRDVSESIAWTGGAGADRQSISGMRPGVDQACESVSGRVAALGPRDRDRSRILANRVSREVPRGVGQTADASRASKESPVRTESGRWLPGPGSNQRPDD